MLLLQSLGVMLVEPMQCLAPKSDNENSLICWFLDSLPPLLPQVQCRFSTSFTQQLESGHQPVFGQSAAPLLSPIQHLPLIPVAPIPKSTDLLFFSTVTALYLVLGNLSSWSSIRLSDWQPSEVTLPSEASMGRCMLSLQASWTLIIQGSLLNATSQARSF